MRSRLFADGFSVAASLLYWWYWWCRDHLPWEPKTVPIWSFTGSDGQPLLGNTIWNGAQTSKKPVATKYTSKPKLLTE